MAAEKGKDESFLRMVLSNMEENIREAVLECQANGLSVGMPVYVEVDMALDADGLPVVAGGVEAARLKTRVYLKSNKI